LAGYNYLKFNKMKKYLTLFFTLFNLAFGFAQEASAEGKLAKIATNPIANMITIPFQFNFNFGMTDYDRYGTVLNIQPVIPFRLNAKWNVVTRTMIPLMQKPLNEPNGSTYGIGNTNMSMFLTPAITNKLIWGVGPALNIPTSSSPELGGDAFGLGPSIMVMYMTGDHWAFGINANQTWSYKSDDLNAFFGQYMIIYNIKKGWFVNTMPTIKADFNESSGNQWTVPIGLGGGKVEKIGKQPFKFQLQGYYTAVKPEGGADWTLQASLFILFPKGKMMHMNK
jgi:hypothetical protein